MKKLTAVAVSSAGLLALGGSLAVFRPRPTKIVVTKRAGDDTVVVNQMHASRLAAMVVDQYGRAVVNSTTRYERISGDSMDISADGSIDCNAPREAIVRATFERLSKHFVLRCRPVASIEAPSWLELMVGDSARELSFVARGPDGRIVTELRGTIRVEDGGIAAIEGTSVRAKRVGMTFANVDVGHVHTAIPIGVYEPVRTFDNRPPKPMMGMRVALARGDTIEVPMQKAAFWVTYYSSDHGAPPTIELRGNGACTTGNGIRVRRVDDGTYAKYCNTGDGAHIMIGHGATGADTVRGLVAVRLMW